MFNTEICLPNTILIGLSFIKSLNLHHILPVLSLEFVNIQSFVYDYTGWVGGGCLVELDIKVIGAVLHFLLEQIQVLLLVDDVVIRMHPSLL